MKPAPEQIEGVRALIRPADRYRVPGFALFDFPGAGKSKQVIDAACALYEAGEIDTVLVLCPSHVKPTWVDRDFGQIKEHCFVESTVCEISNRNPVARWYATAPALGLTWIVIGYEYMIRHEKDITAQLEGRRVFAVADESIKISNYAAQATKVSTRIADRGFCVRRVVLNGTPGDMEKCYSQYRFLGREFWPYENYFHYRAHFCVMGGPRIGGQYRKIVAFKHKDEFDSLTVPYTLRRDKPASMPAKTYNVLSCTLSASTWKVYCAMRKDMIAWLEKDASVASQAVTKGLRLSQITSGFLGGIQDLEHNVVECREVGCEKTDALLSWIAERKESKPDLRLILWCRFRPEIERLITKVSDLGWDYHCVIGAQKKDERKAAEEEFGWSGSDKGCLLVAQVQAGGMGLNLPTADEEVFLSNSYNVFERTQAEDRPHRRGRTKGLPVWDMLAYGPDGQKTIDHAILKALRAGVDLHAWTAANWRAALSEDFA